MCAYPRTGIREPTCPECGYVLTDEDSANIYRWKMFLEFTRGSPWRRWGVLVLFAFAVLTLRDYERSVGPIVICVVGCVSMAAALLGSRFVPTRGLRGRALRRCWLIAGVYAQLFWRLPATAYVLPRPVRQALFGTWTSDYSWESLTVMLAISGFAGAAFAVAAFKRTCRHAGLTLAPNERTALIEGLKLALSPQFLMVVAAAIFGVVALLDRLRPRWWWRE